MSFSSFDLAKHYCVDDVESATISGTRLNNILAALARHQPLSAVSKDFLTERGLLVLVGLANGEIHEDRFNQLARTERASRVAVMQSRQQVMEAQRQADQAAADARQAAMWTRIEAERIARERDPQFIAKQRGRELRREFGVECFVEEDHFKCLMAMLRKLDIGSRLPEEDFVWLKSEGREYVTPQILHVHNRLEADFYLAEYKRTGDAWKAVNASGRLRKCDASNEAHDLLAGIPDSRLKQAKLRSAVLTTHGGAMRDLRRYDEAVKLGEEAHSLQPDSLMPCTLLGAINIELGHIEVGHEWYCKAEERSARPDSIESELRSVLARLSLKRRTEITSQLLSIDPDRYGWLRREKTEKAERRV